jgi:RsiW-degrading membrane proteinase PrsW (M82 family)
MNEKATMSALSLVFLIPIILTLVLGVIGFALNRNKECQMPNTLLWVLVGLFILGPGIVSVIFSMRVLSLRNEYELRKIVPQLK